MTVSTKPKAAAAGDYIVKDISLADFGRKEEEFSWERTDKAATLAAESKATRAA